MSHPETHFESLENRNPARTWIFPVFLRKYDKGTKIAKHPCACTIIEASRAAVSINLLRDKSSTAKFEHGSQQICPRITNLVGSRYYRLYLTQEFMTLHQAMNMAGGLVNLRTYERIFQRTGLQL
jgi:hypothetical protein